MLAPARRLGASDAATPSFDEGSERAEMEIFYIVVRSFLIAFGALLASVYIVMQLWQKVPTAGFQLKPYDTVTYGLVGFLFGVGLNSYWGLLAFVPLLLAKLLNAKLLQKNRLRGSGRWMEIQWMKMTPKGFQLPAQMAQELQRLPGDTHFIVPRFVSLWAVKFFVKSVRKNADKVPANMRGQEAQAFEMLERMAVNIGRLDAGKTEQLSLPFGLLKITRL